MTTEEAAGIGLGGAAGGLAWPDARPATQAAWSRVEKMQQEGQGLRKDVMPEELASYLNDHLAGSVVALQTITHLISATADKPELANFLKSLEAEIESDQTVLKQIIAGVGHTESGAKKVAAWGAEKISWLKFEISGTNNLGLLEALESLVLGITGKLGLWQILDSLKSAYPALEGFGFGHLMQRATEQCESVNRHRISVGREIFAPSDLPAAPGRPPLS